MNGDDDEDDNDGDCAYRYQYTHVMQWVDAYTHRNYAAHIHSRLYRLNLAFTILYLMHTRFLISTNTCPSLSHDDLVKIDLMPIPSN